MARKDSKFHPKVLSWLSRSRSPEPSASGCPMWLSALPHDGILTLHCRSSRWLPTCWQPTTAACSDPCGDDWRASVWVVWMSGIAQSIAVGEIGSINCQEKRENWWAESVNLAGAEGFEPSPSSLTVRCPTGWTTPQRAAACLCRRHAEQG